MTRSFQAVLLSAALLFSAGAVHAQDQVKGDKEAGKSLIYTCAGCHGVPGYQNAYPTYHVPRLVGQNEQYVVDALHEYQKGSRKHPTMNAQAESMSDQDIADIAAYLSSFEFKQKKTAAKVEAPKAAATCESCHGQTGVSIADQYPNLAGQYADYIVQVLHEYKSGQRDNAIMKGFAAQLSEKDMQDIADYFSNQQPVLEDLKGHIQGD